MAPQALAPKVVEAKADEPKSAEPAGHLFIAGTGRTGTSFLVRYLTELGLDTHISRHGCAQFDSNANAGFEDLPLAMEAGQLPYVVKSPWIGEYIDRILAKPEIKIDAVIVPVRDLMEAAASRTIVELRAFYQTAPWMAELDATWENLGLRPAALSSRSIPSIKRVSSPSASIGSSIVV